MRVGIAVGSVLATILAAVWIAAPSRAPADASLRLEVDALPGAPVAGIADAAVAWTGDEFVVVGGVVGTEKLGPDGEPDTADDRPVAVAHALDPTTRVWRPLPDPPLAARSRATAVWTAEEVVVWGGTAERNGVGGLLSGAAYDPATDTWRSLPASPPGTDRSFAQAVAVDGRVVLGAGVTPSSEDAGTLAVLDLGEDSWSTVPGDGAVAQLLDLGDGTIGVLRVVEAAEGVRSRYVVERRDATGALLAVVAELDEPADVERGEFPWTAGIVGVGERLWLVLAPADGDARLYRFDADDVGASPAPVARVANLDGPVRQAGLGEIAPTARIGPLTVSFGDGVGFAATSVGLDPVAGVVVDVTATDDATARSCVNGSAFAATHDGRMLLTGGDCDPALVALLPTGRAVPSG